MQEIEYSTKNEANSLIIERDILTKTIFRVYQQGSNLTKIQRDKLLTRYQYQLGVVVTKIEELGNAMRNTGTNHSDEGLFAAMEQKLSRIDERLEEMSSRKTPSNKRAERQTQKNVQSSVQKNKKKIYLHVRCETRLEQLWTSRNYYSNSDTKQTSRIFQEKIQSVYAKNTTCRT